MFEFTEEEKIAAFDQISAHYYSRNFGLFPKANLDILMFSIYLEHCIQCGEPTDDYSLSKALGISQAKIRTMKQNSELQYPSKRVVGWKEEFAACTKNARYDKTKQLVKLTIPEITTITELRHLIVANGLYDEYQLNPRLFQCRIDVFAEICSLLEKDGISFDDESKKKLKALKAKIPEEAGKSAVERICAGDWKGGLLELSRFAGEKILAEALDLIPFSGIAKSAISGLCKAVVEAE